MTPPLYRPGQVVYVSGTSCVKAHLIHRSFTNLDSTMYQMADGNNYHEGCLHSSFAIALAAAQKLGAIRS